MTRLAVEYQEQLLAVVPKFSGGVGMPSSILLMSEVVLAHMVSKNQKGGNPILRSLAGTAFFLCLDAFGWFLSTWAVPKGEFAFSSGNVRTCEFQGFLLQVVIGAPLFSCATAFYFWLHVVCGKGSQDLGKYERVIAPVIVLYAFGSAFFLLAMGMYNHSGAVCWIMGSPSGCENSSFIPGEEPCERGNWAWLYGMAMFYIPLWICIGMILIFNVCIYWKLYSGGDSDEAAWFARQSFLYALAFVVTWLPSTIWSTIQWNAESGVFVVDILAAWFEPIGGLWNLIIFLQDRPLSRNRVLRLICCECMEEKDQDHHEIDHYGSKSKEFNKPQPEATAESSFSNS